MNIEPIWKSEIDYRNSRVKEAVRRNRQVRRVRHHRTPAHKVV